MINVEIYRDKDNNITKFIIEGHSGYDKIGKDIVCAAVSSVSQMTVLGLSDVLHMPIGFEMDEAYLECILPENLDESIREKANILLDSMMLFLKEFQRQYTKFVRICEVEV